MTLTTSEKTLLGEALDDGAFNPDLGNGFHLRGIANAEIRASVRALTDEQVRVVLRPYKASKAAEYASRITDLQNQLTAEQAKLTTLNSIEIPEAE